MARVELDSFDVEYLSILDEEGNAEKELLPPLKEEELKGLYQDMYYAREADQRMLKLQRQGRIGTFAPSTGQEAAVLGVVKAMEEEDWFVPTFRELPGLLTRGHPFANNLLFHNGYEEGNEFPEAGRNLPISIIVGSQLLHAVGLAYALKLKGEDKAAVGFCGDGGSSQGDFHESLNFASVWQAPVVFVVQNNQWAISVPRSKQTRAKTIAQKAIAYDMPGLQVDGNDVFAVYSAAREALHRALNGEGPSLIECVTERMMMHTPADDPKKYRSEEEVEKWREKDPIKRMRAFLQSEQIWSSDDEEEMKKSTKERIDREIKDFEKSSDFAPDACFDHVFAQKHEYIEQQRSEFLSKLGKEAKNG